MYIWDALYGKINFDSLIYRCMLSPEVQRLREVRLCNINSLCITGSANINRFEHSVGTAYLASINIESNAQRHLKLSKKDKETFIVSALLHDVANGPFGHSYEYIMEKQGFVPEKGIGDVLLRGGNGSYKQSTTFEPIFFGRLKSLHNILDVARISSISKIISGEHPLSPLINSSIDLDNIDNVFRMAYHMGFQFTKEAPFILAKSMFITDGKVVFKREAEPFLNEWFHVRKQVYEFLLLNPQEFAGKYMLTEAMDILFECISEKKAEDKDIKWYYTDYELMIALNGLNEVPLERKMLLFKGIDPQLINSISQITLETQRKADLRDYLQSVELMIPIKEKGKSGNSKHLQLNENYQLSFDDANIVKISDRGMVFTIEGINFYKVISFHGNTSKIVSRLMTGDLYDCLLIIKTDDINKYGDFLDYSKRVIIEADIEARIKIDGTFSHLRIGVHPILDVKKTERQLSVFFNDSDTPVVVGKNASRCLLIGVFLKNEPYGLSHGKVALAKHRQRLREVILSYFASYFVNGAIEVPLYEEAIKYGK